jgi:hypothetical protein
VQNRIRDHIRSNIVGYIALFCFAMGGSAYALDGPLPGQNQVGSEDIINGEVRNGDLGADAVASGKIDDRQVKNADLGLGASSSNTIADGGIQGIDVKSNTLTGTQIDESAVNGGGDVSGPLSNLQLGSGAVGPDETGAVPAVRAVVPADRDPSFGGCLIALGPNHKGNNTASGVPEALPFETEAFDTAGMHIAGSNCEDPDRARLTAPRSGMYLLSTGVLWEQNGVGTRYLGINRFDSSGNGPIGLAADERAANDAADAGSTLQSVSTVAVLNQGDYVTAEVNQTSGGNLHAPLVGEDSRNYFSAIWLAPAP